MVYDTLGSVFKKKVAKEIEKLDRPVMLYPSCLNVILFYCEPKILGMICRVPRNVLIDLRFLTERKCGLSTILLFIRVKVSVSVELGMH